MVENGLEVQIARIEVLIAALKEAFTDEKTSSKEAIRSAFAAAESATAAALLAQKESAGKTEANQKAQLELHNGLIRKMDNLVAGFPTKDALAAELAIRDAAIGRIDRAVAWAYGAGAAGVALSGLAIYLAKG